MYHAGHECVDTCICIILVVILLHISTHYIQNMPPYEKYLCASLMENKMPENSINSA